MATPDFSDLLDIIPPAQPNAGGQRSSSVAKQDAAQSPRGGEDFSDLIDLIPPAPPGSSGQGSAGGNVAAFVSQYRPLAERVSQRIGVAPEALLGQWGLETGWGRSIIPGTNNLGNIKDFSGGGVQAVDNMTGSRDGYRIYESPEDFGDGFAGLIERRYRSAVGAGSDPERFFSALKMGGYAEDPDYVLKGVNATRMAAAALGSSPASQQSDRPRFSNTFREPVPERTAGEAIRDTALAGGAGVMQGIGMVAGAFGADNPVARFADEAAEGLMDRQSPARQEERARRAELIAEAEASGSMWEEVKANVGAFIDAPIETTVNAIGTSAPTILSALIPGVNKTVAARLIVQGAMGAAQGAGAVKGGIYEELQRKLIESGVDPVEAEKIAVGAQAYDSQNGGNIAVGAILGAVAGTTGIEGVVSKIIGGPATRDLVERGVIRRAGVGALKEAPTEGLQGGQQRYATNVALQNEGFDVPTFQGVAGQAAGEAIASAPGGAIFGALDRGGAGIPPELAPAVEKSQEPDSPLSKAAVAGADQFIAQKQAEGAANQGQQPDPISQRIAEIEQEIRANGVLDTLRTIGQRGLTEKEFLEALSIARNPGMDAKSPLIRQRALESVEEAMGWAREGRMPGVRLSDSTSLAAQPPQPAPPQPGTDLATMGSREVGPVGAGQFFDPNIVDVDATRVDNMLPGPRAIEGPRPRIGASQQPQASAQPQDAAPAEPSVELVDPPQGMAEPEAAEAATQPEVPAQQPVDTSAQSRALSVDEATRGLPRVQIPAATDQEKGEAGTAQRRKRKAQFSQLAEIGYDTVERRDNGFLLVNSKTGQQVVIESPAEAQLARNAIKSHVDALANTAAASPLNDRLEPTEAQIRANNYKKSDVIDLNGVKVKIENPAGSVRRGVGADGRPWETKMAHHYGEIQGTEGADGDKVDVFIGNRPDSNRVFVVDQVNPDGTFDEHKLVFGALNEDDARQTYLANYEEGWSGLGAITEIPAGELKAWLKENAKKPARKSEPEAITVNVDGKSQSVRAVPIDELPESSEDSPTRGGQGRRVTKKQARLLKQLAAFFGKDVVFFSDPDKKVASDGFVRDGNDVTIYLNEESGISPLAVFGHELMHILRRDNPKAYEAIERVVKSRVKNAKGFRTDYYGKGSAESKKSGDLNDHDLEELISDLNGNLMSDQTFWKEVFDQIQKDNGAEAKGIIAKLVAQLQRLVDSISSAFKGQPTYAADRFVSDLAAIRVAFRDGLADYAKSQGVSQASMQAEVLRARQREGESGGRAPKPTDGITVEGYHFSQAARPVLTTGAFGTGLRGSDRDEIMSYPDARVRERLSFYVNKGTGIRPESGVGGIAHKATLTNIYDADADTRRLKQGRSKREFEVAVINAGYSGYLTRLEGSQPGQVILLGRQTIEPEVLGPRTRIDDAAVVPPKAKREPDLGDRLSELQIPLNGQLSPSTWASMIMARDPELAAQLMDIGALSGDKSMYKDELVASVRQKTGVPKKSPGPQAAGIIFKAADTGRILMAKRGSSVANPGTWSIPGGAVDAGESLEAAALREAKEEIGFQGQVKLTRIAEAKFGNANFNTFIATVPSEFSIRLNGENSEAKWFDPDALPDQLHPGFRGVKDQVVGAAKSKNPAAWSLDGGEIKRSAQRAKDEYAEVEAKYKGTDAWMRAPNGAKTNLNERQWVQVRTPAFKAWFGDWEAASAKGDVWNSQDVSKAVDENGEPLVVYHGTDKGGFMVFDQPSGRGRGDLGIFTTNNWDMARSYVRKNRVRDIEPQEFPSTRAELEALDFEFTELDGGRVEVDTPMGYAESYASEELAVSGVLESYADEIQEMIGGGAGTQPGVYALFLNIRNPNEDDFAGAAWNGERVDQYQVFDEDGENIEANGEIYFDLETAQSLVDRNPGSELTVADPHFNSTDDVVREAWRSKNDGAIISRVVDDGGGPGAYDMEPATVYVALRPEQLKSADFNNGEFRSSTTDIRKSKKRLTREHELEMSTRVPSSKNKSVEDHMGNLLISDFSSVKGNKKWVESVASLVTQYPAYRDTPSANTPEKKLERLINQMADNLVWLHDQVPAETRKRSKLWYDGANEIAQRISRRHGISDAQSAGILATLSPQKDWFMNVSLAERVTSIMAERQRFRWSSEMEETAARIYKAEQYQEALEQVRGKSLAQLDGDDYLSAVWLRVYDQTYNSRSFDIVSPEGDSLARAQTKKGVDANVAWGGNKTIAKAISIFRDGSAANISDQLGAQHKVRNFYNNILVPNSKNGHVTVDTHAVAAAQLRPLSGESIEVKHNFDGVSNALSGLKGIYAIYDEAYRRAAGRVFLLPRELQSISWEAIRGMYPPGFKSQQKNVESIDKIWVQFRKGRLSYDGAREFALETAGGIEAPSWLGRNPGIYVEEQLADESEDLSGDGVSGGGSEEIVIRADRDDSGASETGARLSRDRAGLDQSGGDPEGEGSSDGSGRLSPLPGYAHWNIKGAAGPDPRLVQVAEKYARENGINLRRQAEYVKVDPERAARIAKAYDEMPHTPQNPRVKEAFANLIRQTRAQYDALIAAGYEFTFFDSSSDPYGGNPWNAMRDLRANQRMAVYGTYDGYGTEGITAKAVDDNPMLADTGLQWRDQSGQLRPVAANDLFRAVHDAFGHGLEGAGFRADGEENAWQAHVRLFTGSAIGAITSETRGQNSWLNYGPYGETNRTATLEGTVFAEQKTGLMPEWTWSEGISGDQEIRKSPNRATLDDFAPGKIGSLLSKTDWAILTAENPRGETASAAQNRRANAKLESELRARELPYMKVVGRYGGPDENSFVVVNLSHGDALDIAQRYDQDSVLTPDGLVYQDGTVNPAGGIEVFRNPPENYFSKVGGTIFRVNIDFDSRIPREQAQYNRRIEALENLISCLRK